MRMLPWSAFVCLFALLVVPGVSADEGEGSSKASAVAEKALEALKLRIEARLKEGELLSKAGRTEEALEAYRSVGQIYERGMELIREISWRLAGQGNPTGVAARPLGLPTPAPTAPGAGLSFEGRGGAREMGPGQKKYLDSVDEALRWLHAHQSPNGGWEAVGFAQWCNAKPVIKPHLRPDGAGKALHDPGVTGLALLAFLGAGYTNRGKHPFAETVKRGLRYLKNIQDPEGCFGPRSSQQYIYHHAMCALAMVEAYGMTESPVLQGSAQKALDFIAGSRNPYFAWRYGIKPGDNDTSVTAWMVMVLKSASIVNASAARAGKPLPLTIDEAAFDGARAWLDKVTDPDYGRVGYMQRGTGPARPQDLVDRFPGEKSEAMTAAGMLARIFMGEDPRLSGVIKKGADLLARLPPVWNPADGSIDMYYWYYGTLAMFQVGGRHWQTWKQGIERAVLPTQRKDTDYCQYKGSWDPIGPWGVYGGRVYSTALLCLIAQVHYRYDKVFGTK